MQPPAPPQVQKNSPDVRARLIAEDKAGKRVPYLLMVSGFARSGTSLMMQILAASGVTCSKHENVNTRSKELALADGYLHHEADLIEEWWDGILMKTLSSGKIYISFV